MPPRHRTAQLLPRHHHHPVRSVSSVRCVALVALLVCALDVAPAGAQTMTLDQAVRVAQQQVPGKLVAAVTERRGEQTVYLIRILGADGVVRTVMIDASAKH